MYKLSADEKEELRRLTQKANRRIVSAHKSLVAQAPKRRGRPKPVIIPMAVTGDTGKQLQSQWATKSTPFSRSVTQFEDKQQFKEHMKKLRLFDGEGPQHTQTLKQYEQTSSTKILKAFENVGVDLTEEQIKTIKNMNITQQRAFWKKFDEISSRYFNAYSSDQVFADMVADPELFQSFIKESTAAIKPKKSKKRTKRK